MNEDTVRCPGCRGAKKVPKLGGMIGDCNACSGKGSILTCDKPVMIVAESAPIVDDIIKATAYAAPASDNENQSQSSLKSVCAPSAVVEEQVKVDGKKAVFKRKK